MQAQTHRSQFENNEDWSKWSKLTKDELQTLRNELDTSFQGTVNNKSEMEAIQKEALDMLVSDAYTTLAKRIKLGMIHNQKRVSAQLKAVAQNQL